MSLLQQLNLTPPQMLDGIEDFFGQIRTFASDIGLSLDGLQADHIALRINDSELAATAHQAWLEYGKVISQAVINGRPIIVLLFDEPINVGQWSIECLELPYPAEGKIYPSQGWEHVEFVVPSQAQTADEFFGEVKTQFPQLEAALSEQNIKVKLSSPKGEGERLANPTVAFKREGICIKLHPHSLKDVVASEQS
ncbi:VOC family protein [Vibrio sp. SCSIO 43136]|uniref:VOC family protein n=1 Tax=Vibrio sp. SCSIO 43136 TaxID=2819101 RepID=UPI002076633C|nr:VOC family protein [Vibrio sp. SCSIO 43136]USD64531.1 VOC family protein [Vibrio sp. SCSIO 43136]